MRELLKDNWFLICSKDINDCGEAISTAGYKADKWYRAKVPGTVIASLVENGCYDDPYYGLNLTKLPGYKKRRDINFSLQEKPARSPFKNSWWYRTEFIVGKELKGKRIWLNFRGINGSHCLAPISIIYFFIDIIFIIYTFVNNPINKQPISICHICMMSVWSIIKTEIPNSV